MTLTWLQRHPLAGFFLLTFLLSWSWLVIALGVLHLPMMGVAGIVAPFVGPTLAAFVMSAVTGGRAAVYRLLRGYVRWKVPPQWYLLAVLGWPAVTFLGVLAQPGAVSAFRWPTAGFVLGFLTVFVVIFVTGGPLGEEPGWRGFALPHLQRLFGPLPGSLLLGAVHGLWHLPIYLLVAGYNGAPADLPGILLSFGTFVLTVTVGAVIITWIFNNTKESLLPVMLLHAANNAAGAIPSQLFPGFGADLVPVRLWSTIAAAALIVVLTRGRLSYREPLPAS
jgi:membrane protease YdiL (CAAX protease family)